MGIFFKDEFSLDMVAVGSITERVVNTLKENLELQGKNFVEYMCINSLWHLFDDKYLMFGLMDSDIKELFDIFGVGLTEVERDDIISRYNSEKVGK